jgi:hypothetical protein
VCLVTRCFKEKQAYMWLYWETEIGSLCLVSLGSLSVYFFTCFSIIICKCEHNNFSEFCNSFWKISEPEQYLLDFQSQNWNGKRATERNFWSSVVMCLTISAWAGQCMEIILYGFTLTLPSPKLLWSFLTLWMMIYVDLTLNSIRLNDGS